MAEPRKLTIDDIPAYRRPLGATQVFGEIDELGNPMYRMPSGKKFSLVSLMGEQAEEQAEMDRWPLGKVAADARDAVWEYMKDPALPSWSQIKSLPKALMQGAADEINSAREMPTPANILGLTVGVGAASAATTAPAGALRVFGGRKAKGSPIDRAREDIRERLGEDAELDPDLLYDEYGVFKAPDGGDRFEISDEGLGFTKAAQSSWDEMKGIIDEHFNPSIVNNEDMTLDELMERAQEPIRFADIPLGEIIDHPALYAAYPELSELKLNLFQDPGGSDTLGSYVRMPDGSDFIELNLGAVMQPNGDYDFELLLPTLVHEIQHKIQRIEGFDSGTSPSATKSLTPQGIRRLEDGLEAVAKEGAFFEDIAKAYGQDATVLGRRTIWQPAEWTPEIRRMDGNEFQRNGYLANEDGTLEQLAPQVVIEVDGKVQGIQVPQEHRRATVNLPAIGSIKDIEGIDLDAYYKNVRRFKVGDDEVYMSDADKALKAGKRIRHLRQLALDKDFQQRAALDGRDAYHKYRMTAGELEANAVGSLFQQGQRLRWQNKGWTKQTPIAQLEREKTLAGGGEVIRKQTIAEGE